MSTNGYQVQSIHKYSRKTYKAHQNDQENTWNGGDPYDSINNEVAGPSRNDEHAIDPRSCECDVEQEGELTNILHKKCPVITLAQQQLQRLLDETDKLFCDNTRCCR